MQTWDKMYLTINDLLHSKNKIANNLWSLAQYPQTFFIKNTLLSLWRTEIHHTANLNKLMQSLGYNQLHLMDRTIIEGLDPVGVISEIITTKEKWLPILEKISGESFGNNINLTLIPIIADEYLNRECLEGLKQNLFQLEK